MRTQLDCMYEHERTRGAEIWLTQPMGGGRLRNLTFAEGMQEARRMAAHLRSLGLPAGSSIAIFSKNTAWWLLADLAIWMAGHVSVPIYPTLAAGDIRQILEHSKSRLIFIGKLDGYAQMEPGIPAELPRIALPLGPVQVTPRWEELIARTEPLAESPVREPDALATIVYTSGSTGVPKGVMHSFRTMCSAQIFVDYFGFRRDDRMISYLPLAHVAERALLETPNFLVGFHVFFAESLDTFLTDVQRAQPTIFGSVPRLWQKFQSGIYAKVPPQKLNRLLGIPLLGTLVKRKIVRGLGLSQVRLVATGSAPTPPELHAFYGRLGLELLEVYGMSENFAVSHIARPGECKPGYIGPTLPGVSTRFTEAGELCVKSPGTMVGYYEAPELTKETVDADGYLHTGDRGEVDVQGRLRLTGRVKEIFKSSKGKYVAPAPIENQLLAHPSIEQACVMGANLSQPFAVVVLSEAARQKSSSPSGRTELEAELRGHFEKTNTSLSQHEQLDKLVVGKDEWTVENGLLTPTMKIRRSALEERYAPLASGWLSRPESVIWS